MKASAVIFTLTACGAASALMVGAAYANQPAGIPQGPAATTPPVVTVTVSTPGPIGPQGPPGLPGQHGADGLQGAAGERR